MKNIIFILIFLSFISCGVDRYLVYDSSDEQVVDWCYDFIVRRKCLPEDSVSVYYETEKACFYFRQKDFITELKSNVVFINKQLDKEDSMTLNYINSCIAKVEASNSAICINDFYTDTLANGIMDKDDLIFTLMWQVTNSKVAIYLKKEQIWLYEFIHQSKNRKNKFYDTESKKLIFSHKFDRIRVKF